MMKLTTVALLSVLIISPVLAFLGEKQMESATREFQKFEHHDQENREFPGHAGHPGGHPHHRKPGKLAVSGIGEVDASPDSALVRVGFEDIQDNLQQALRNVTSAVDRALAALTRMGMINEQDIKSTSFYMQAQRNYGYDSRQVHSNYQVSTSYEISVSDIKKVSDVVESLAKSGDKMLSINGIEMLVSNSKDLQNQAYRLAIQNARARAEILAEEAGVRLGGIHRISTITSNGNFGMKDFAASSQIYISGSSRISSSVEVVYRIHPHCDKHHNNMSDHNE